MSAERAVYAVVVEYWSEDCLARCVASLLAQDELAGVVVADNGSEPDAARRLAVFADPRLRVITTGGNPGFARGVATALREVPADARVLLVNPDCELPAGAVDALAAVLDVQPDIGLVAPIVVGPDGEPPASSLRRIPTLAHGLRGLLKGLTRRFPGRSHIESQTDEGVAILAPGVGVSGACLMVASRFRARHPVLDTGFFMHFEDLDLMRRVLDAGWRIALHRGVRVRHLEGVSSRRHPFRVHAHKHRSMWRYLRKHERVAMPVWWLLAAALFLRWLLLLPVVASRHLGHRTRRGR